MLVHGFDRSAVNLNKDGACSVTASKDYSTEYFSLENAPSHWGQLRALLESGGYDVWVYRWPTQLPMEAAAYNLRTLISEDSRLRARRVSII